MKIFLAGASGVIGQQLVPLLVGAGHEVLGMTRTPERAEILRALGAEPLVCDVYDRAALTDAMMRFAPQLVMHQLTDLPDDVARIADYAASNSRIRREGTRNLLDAARAAGVPRVIAQSVAWELPGEGGAAKRELEDAVLAAGGVVLRYGRLYGPGTYYEGDAQPEAPAVSVAEAARRTAALLDAPSGIVVVAEE
jgi:nucleoside-diphosphate-sugar epimerase